MLRRLTIHNYALIDKIEWDCVSGWTVLTGETGSGKSILLGALGLVLGDRADSAGALRQDKCIVEAEFAPSPAARTMLGDLDEGGDCTIRRSIAPGGRSRAYINDEPVKLHRLKALAPLLVDLHGQQDGQRLHASEGLLHAIDSYSSEAGQLAQDWREKYTAWAEAKRAQARLSAMDGLPEADEGYLRFQIQELAELDFADPALRDLDARLNQLSHAHEIRHALEAVHAALQGEDGDIIGQLSSIEQALGRVAGLHPAAGALLDRIRSSRIELDDAAQEAQSAAEAVDLDPAALAKAEADKDMINRLLDKHRAADLDTLADKFKAMQEQLEHARDRTDKLSKLSAEVDRLRNQLDEAGSQLQVARRDSGTALCTAILDHLKHLKLPAADIAFDWTATQAPEASGPERASLVFSANPGQPMQPLTKVASGGERSRVMLSLKAALTEFLEVPTLILDEIDAGVSGDVAARMADLIAAISKGAQVITISHLPQVAGKADHHMRVFKEERDGRAHTGMTRLDAEGRIEELAAMLSGEVIGDAARAQARALMA
jgi:DNA repair protein RecN (Recombination protein N)